MGAVAAEHQVGVGVDQARRDPAPLAIDHLRRIEITGAVLARPDEGDAAVTAGQDTVVDHAEPLAGLQGGQTGVSPEAITLHGVELR